jgi:hypothetical protein
MVARGRGSLMNITPCPTNTSSSSVTPSQTKVRDDLAAGHRRLPFLDFHERSDLGECADFALEHVHQILVNDQNALTEDDVPSDRLDAERILVVNLQQSCFSPVPKF